MMKKFLAIILALIMVVGTAACGAKPAAMIPQLDQTLST